MEKTNKISHWIQHNYSSGAKYRHVTCSNVSVIH